MKYRRQRRQIAASVAEELATQDEFVLEGRKIRYFRSPFYEEQMRQGLQRRISERLQTPVDVKEIKSGRQLVAFYISKRDI